MHLAIERSQAGLMARAEPGAVIAMEVFIKENVVAPVRIGLKFLRAAEKGAPAVLVTSDYPEQKTARKRFPGSHLAGSIFFPDPVGHSTVKLSP